MERRAHTIKTAPPLRYIFPHTSGLSATDGAAARAAGLPLARLLIDVHVPGGGGALDVARALFASPPDRQWGDEWGVANLETNADRNDMQVMVMVMMMIGARDVRSTSMRASHAVCRPPTCPHLEPHADRNGVT